MSPWRQLIRGVRALLNRRKTDGEIADEVESYLSESARDFEAAGLSCEEAKRAARRDLGSTTAVREEVRSYGWENAITSAVSDARYAARRLWGTPGFTVVCVLTLALGIGASTAIFSVVEGVLLKPLPYPRSERVVALRHTAPGIHIADLNMAASLYFTYSTESRAFQNVAMWTPGTVSITGSGTPEQMAALAVTHEFLSVLGVAPETGRGFMQGDDNPSGESVVMLSDGYWRARYGGAHSVVGRRIRVDGLERTIVGVLPRSFQFMDREATMLLPLRMRRADVQLISFCCQGVARMKPGVSLAQANADVARMLPIAAKEFPINRGFSPNAFAEARIAPRVRLLKDVWLGEVGKTLWVLLGAVGLMLLIACSNVANLLLVRVDGRRQELAVRKALGAGWGRLTRELLMESLWLSGVGGFLGLGLAFGGVRLVTAEGMGHLPRVHEVGIDPAVLAFAFVVSVLTGVVFGLTPAMKKAGTDVAAELRGGGRAQSSSRERNRTRGLLVVLQVGLAVVLVVGSGLMIRTFQALRHVDPGFAQADTLQTFQVSILPTQAKEDVRAIRMEEEILRKVEAIGGTAAVGIINDLPMEGGSNDPIYVQDQAVHQRSVPPVRRFKYVSPGYFAAVGTRLVAGRDLTWKETYDELPVALVSENLAREFWGDPQAAIGKRIRSSLKDDWREVIGVVADVRDNGVNEQAPSIVYWPLLQKNFESAATFTIRDVRFVMRSQWAGSLRLVPELRRAVASVNGSLPIADVKTLQSVYDRSLALTSFASSLLIIAGGMSLILGLVGLYGVLSYAVAQRTREIGIRLALGASLGDVTGMFLGYGLRLAGVGAVSGLAAALLLTRLMQSLLYGVSSADPFTYGAAFGGIIVAAALASYLPARRATKVDPVVALRAE
jgi:predicted permease